MTTHDPISVHSQSNREGSERTNIMTHVKDKTEYLLELGELLVAGGRGHYSERTGIVINTADGKITVLWVADGRTWRVSYDRQQQIFLKLSSRGE